MNTVVVLCSLFLSVVLCQLPSSSITTLANTGRNNLDAIYSLSQDLYCISGNGGINCYDASTDALLATHTFGGFAFWMQAYENTPSAGVAGLIFCRHNGGNSGVFTLDLNRARINNPPRLRVDLNDDLEECAVDFASNRFMFSVEDSSGQNDISISTQVDMDQLDPNIDGPWVSNLIDYQISPGRANRERNSNAVVRGVDSNPRYFWTENGDDIYIMEQNTENLQRIEYLNGITYRAIAADDTDPNNIFLWLGTDLGLLWKINVVTGDIDDVVIAIGYDQRSIQLDNANSVVFFAGESTNGLNGRWFRADFNETSSIIVDFIDIPTTNQVRSTALDTTNQRMWIFTDDGSRFRVDFGDCSMLPDTCGECLQDRIYCTWCYDNGSCQNTGTCSNPLGSSAPAEADPQNCPAITDFSPITGLPGSNIAVTLNNDVARPELGLQCRFDGMNPVTGTLSNGNTVLNCAVPALTGTQGVTVAYPDGSSFATGSELFAFISCSANSDCGSCINNDGCSWCLDDLQCFETASATCATTSIPSGGPSSCPIFNPLVPATNPANTAFSTTISPGPFVDNGGSYRLVLNPGNIIAPAQFDSTSQLTANVPAVAANTYIATLERDMTDYFGVGQTLEVFDCASITECGTCTDSAINCIWCTEDRMCRNPADVCSSGGQTAEGQCPDLVSLNPPSEFTSGSPSPLTITTSGILPMGTYECDFGGSVVSASVAGSIVTCMNIPMGSGSVQLDLLVNSDPTPVITTSFLYFTCATFSDSCGNCLDPVLNGDCEYCFEDGVCSETGMGVCPSGILSTCATVTAVSPMGVDVDTIQPVTFTLNAVPDIGTTYECVWSTPAMVPTTEMTIGTRTSPTTIVCDSPAGDVSLIGAPPDSTFYEVTVDIQSPPGLGSSILASSSLTIFDCPLIGTNDCTTCSALPFCGLCLGPNICNSLSECLLAGSTVSLWLDGSMGCPTITQVQPDHSSVSGGNEVSVIGSLFLVDELECLFGDGERTPATRISDTQLSCMAPPSTMANSSLSIAQASITYSDNSQEFLFIDCSSFTDCESCTADVTFDGRCGWCLTTGSCAPVFECPVGDWQESLCPSITGISPGFSEFGQTTDFELTGTLFRPGVDVFFGQIAATDVVVESDTLISGTSPEFEDDGTGAVQVTLMINGASYSSAFIGFNLIPESSSGSGNVGAAVGATLGVLCLFVCCAACVIWLLYTRFKNIMSRRTVKIVEPKWDVLAYSNWLTLLYKAKSVRTYDNLADLLTQQPLPLLLATNEVTQTTEQDPLARAVTYIFLDKTDLCQSMIFLIKTEVKAAAQLPETLFRSNSLTTKIFKYYAKIIGARYLFNILARYIAEMELSRKLQQEDVAELNTLHDMELDPRKMDEENDELQIQENKTNLLSFSQKILNTILRSIDQIPPPLLKIILTVRDSVQEQFDDSELTFKSIGAFFFLRYICPAIAAPESYFRDDPPDPYIRRQLVLLSKMIQSLANNVQFGGKEQFMAPLNPFITDNAENLRKFYDRLSKVDTSSLADVEVPSEPLTNAYCWIHSYLNNISSQVQTELRNEDRYQNGSRVATQFGNIMDELGDSPEKIKKAK